MSIIEKEGKKKIMLIISTGDILHFVHNRKSFIVTFFTGLGALVFYVICCRFVFVLPILLLWLSWTGFAAGRTDKCLRSDINREHRGCYSEAEEETGDNCDNGFAQHQTDTEDCGYRLPSC